MPPLRQPTPAERAQYWRAGYLGWALTPTGREINAFYYRARKAGVGEIVLNLARRASKSHTILHTFMELLIRVRGARCQFAMITGEEVESTIQPMVTEILRTAPKGLKIKDRLSSAGLIKVGLTDSELHIAGVDKGNYVSLRGPYSTAWALDEAGHVPASAFEATVDGVFAPMTWTTGGTGIIASNPGDTPGHPFQTRYLIAKARGWSFHRDFWRAELINRHTLQPLSLLQKKRIVHEAARKKGLSVREFLKSSVYMREFMAEFVQEIERAIIPGFTEAREREVSVRLESWPIWVDRYTIMDTGGGERDWTAILYAYWDFQRGKLVIVGDRILRQPSTKQTALAVKEDEARLFPTEMPRGCMHHRFLDGTETMLRDLANDHRLIFGQTAKDDLDTAVRTARDWIITDGRVEIDPACRQTVAQLRAGIWNKKRTKFEHVEQFGHFDLVATYVYLVRNCLPHINRMPNLYGVNRGEVFVHPDEVRAADTGWGGLFQ